MPDMPPKASIPRAWIIGFVIVEAVFLGAAVYHILASR